MLFKDIGIDREEIPQDILNIEAKTRSNLFAWNGQFSPQFAEAVLSKYAGRDDFVIDPFAGSGTVLCECSARNSACYGTEINFPAYCMAKIYEASNLSISERLSLTDRISSFILYLSMNGRDILSSLLEEIRASRSSFYADVLSALVVIMDIYHNAVSPDFLQDRWNMLGKIITALPYTSRPVKAERCDARTMNLKNDTADFLLTSPPYINVFNYHQKYRLSAEALGYDILGTARSEIGSNRKNRSTDS